SSSSCLPSTPRATPAKPKALPTESGKSRRAERFNAPTAEFALERPRRFSHFTGVPIKTASGCVPHCLGNQVGRVLDMPAIDAYQATIFGTHDVPAQRHDRADNRYLWRQLPVAQNEPAAAKCAFDADDIVETCQHPAECWVGAFRSADIAVSDNPIE